MALRTIGLSTYRWNSGHKALGLVLLFPVICFLFFWVQVYVTLAVFLYESPAFSHHYLSTLTDGFVYGWGGIGFAAALLGWLFYTWNYHGSVIRGLCLSRPVTGADDPQLYAIIEAVCISQGLPTPEVEIIETPARNSFVCDVYGETSRLFLTRGLIDSLQTDELEAVIAHEIAHILSGDTRLLSFSIAFCDLYPFLIFTMRNPMPHEAPAAIRTELNPLIFAHPLLFVLFLPVWGGYFATSILRVFLFINRELDADAAALQITKNPDALMRALMRIHRRARLPYGNHDLRFLCIDNPSGGFFATHPRLRSRLQAISDITNTPIPQIEVSVPAATHKRFQRNPLLQRAFRKRAPEPSQPFNSPWKV